MPPSTRNSWPVTKPASSESSQATSDATSSTVPTRPTRCWSWSSSVSGAASRSAASRVSIQPGLSALTRISGPRLAARVTPHINDGAALRLEIEQEISALLPNAQQRNNTDLITSKRSIKSTILAENGQVIVIGGLIQDDVSQAESKVPLLGDIPLLGRLFRSTKDTHTKRNLMVFLRPTVVRDSAGLAALSGKKYSDIRVIDGTRGPEGRPSILPTNANQLFDGQAVDLRELMTE